MGVYRGVEPPEQLHRKVAPTDHRADFHDPERATSATLCPEHWDVGQEKA
jgi:hypothetical protein